MPLAYVIWGIGLLSVMAVSLLWSGNVSYRLVRNVTDAAQMDFTVEAVISRTVLGIIDPRYDRRWRVDGIPQEFHFGEAMVRVTIQDELGRIDVNHADGPILMALFQSAGLDASAASRIVDKILDWRESTGLKHLNGATAEDYRAAGLAYRPRSGPFQSLEELQLVMGMTPELFRRVEPALTVYSGRQFVDPQFAPPEVVAALTMSSDAAASLASARTNQGLATPAGVIGPTIPLQGRAFTIRTDIAKATGQTSREVVVRITDNASDPYWVLSWKPK